MALTKIDDRGLKTPIDLIDNEKIRLGTGNDLEIYHDGSNSFISDTGTGGLKVLGSDIYIRNASDQDMIHATSGGAVKLYYNNVNKLETKSDGVEINGHLYLENDEILKLGSGGGKTFFWHDGTNLTLRNYTGNFIVEAKSNEKGIQVIPDGAVEVYHDNVKRFETSATGVTIPNTLTVSDGANLDGDIKFKGSGDGDDFFWDKSADQLTLTDSRKIRFGDSGDLEIYHSGSHSFISNTTGTLQLENAGNITITKGGTENMARFVPDGAVELFYDNSKVFQTVSSGIRVIAGEGLGAQINIYADEGDDNADKWRFDANSAGGFYLQNYTSGAWETNVKAIGDGAVELYYNNSKKLETTNTGGILTGEWTLANNYTLADITHAASAQTRTVTDSTNWVDVDSDGVNRTMSYKRGNVIVIDSQLPASIALSSSGVNYAGVHGRLKITDGTNTEYSETHKAWYRNDDEGTDESVQFMAIKYLIKWDNTAFDDNSTLTVSFQFRRISGTGTTTTSVCGWNSQRWISVTKYKGST